MSRLTRRAHFFSLISALATLATGAIVAQQRPVAAMFGDDQKRAGPIALSFATAEAPPTAALGVPLQIYLTAGDLERAFDQPAFRPDAAIVPTNTELLLTAPAPGTQAVLIDRVRKQTAIMRDLQEQVDAHKKQPSPAGGKPLEVGIDSFVAQLPRQGSRGGAAFPKSVCLIATDFPKGGAIDRRELFAQDRVLKGIAACLTALDASGVESVVLPLMGAASSGTQAKDPVFEGQRVLKECRLLNSVAGIALGIHDFAPARRNIREIGVIQWDQEITDMFSLPRGTRLAQTAQNAYSAYAEQITQGFRRGLAGEKTTAADVGGNCNAIFTQ